MLEPSREDAERQVDELERMCPPPYHLLAYQQTEPERRERENLSAEEQDSVQETLHSAYRRFRELHPEGRFTLTIAGGHLVRKNCSKQMDLDTRVYERARGLRRK